MHKKCVECAIVLTSWVEAEGGEGLQWRGVRLGVKARRVVGGAMVGGAVVGGAVVGGVGLG